MTVLIVGGDRLGNILEELRKEGVKEIIHWTGRAKSFQNKAIPKNVDLVIMFYDFTSHNLMQNVKRQAKMYRIPITYTRRAVVQAAG